LWDHGHLQPAKAFGEGSLKYTGSDIRQENLRVALQQKPNTLETRSFRACLEA